MRRAALPLAALCAAAALAVSALLGAVSPASAVEAGARVGWAGGVDAEKSVPSVGLYLHFGLPGPLALELSGDYWREEVAGAGSVEVVPLRATALLYPLPLPLVRPYVLGGAGMTFLDFHGDEAGREGGKAFSVHGGGGVEASLAGFLTARAEARWCQSGEVPVGGAPGGYRPGGWRLLLSLGMSF